MRIYYYILFFLIFLITPFAFAGAEPWGLLIFNGLSYTLAFLVLFNRKTIVLTSTSKIVFSILLFLITLGLIQTITQKDILQTSYIPFTLCRILTFESLSLLFAYTCIFFTLTQIIKETKHLKHIALFITISSMLLCITALSFQNGEYIKFFTNLTFYSSFGPFTSRNNASQYMLCTFFISLLLWLPKICFQRPLQITNKIIIQISCSLILLIGVWFCHSRAGILSLILSLFTLTILSTLLFTKNKKRVFLLSCSSLLFPLMIYLVIKYSSFLGFRNYGTFSDKSRLIMYSTALDMLKQFPFTGVGLGAFNVGFDGFVKTNLRGIVYNLHSDWLELLLSIGYVFGSFVYISLLCLIYKIIKQIKGLEQKKQLRLIICCAGLVALSFTACVDFPFPIPASGMGFFILLGLLCSRTLTSKITHLNFHTIYKIPFVLLMCGFLFINLISFRIWRISTFSAKLPPSTYATIMKDSLHLYPTPFQAQKTAYALLKASESKNISEEDKTELRKQAHDITKQYLIKYPKYKGLSSIFILTK